MATEWILIANAATARLLRREHGQPLAALASFAHPAGRLQSALLGADRSGREPAGRGRGGAAFAPRLDAQRKEHLQFARELADYLEHAAADARYDTVTLVAGDPFLGRLKEALGAATRRRLADCVALDLTHVGSAELEARIRRARSAPA